jgi:hypothetical protein
MYDFDIDAGYDAVVLVYRADETPKLRFSDLVDL